MSKMYQYKILWNDVMLTCDHLKKSSETISQKKWKDTSRDLNVRYGHATKKAKGIPRKTKHTWVQNFNELYQQENTQISKNKAEEHVAITKGRLKKQRI